LVQKYGIKIEYGENKEKKSFENNAVYRSDPNYAIIAIYLFAAMQGRCACRNLPLIS